MKTIRVFMDSMVSMEYVVPGMADRVYVPDIKEEDKTTDEILEYDRAEEILTHVTKAESSQAEEVVTVTEVRPYVTHMRTYLAPLGFDSRRVVRPVLSEGLDESDRVVLLQPADNSDQSEDAFEEVAEVLTQVVPDLELESEHLPYTDFVETTLLCADLMQAAEGETIVVLGGGAREILLPLTVATFSNENHIDTVLQVGDIDSSVRRIPRLNLRGNISNAEATLLADLTELATPLSISDIATELEKSKSTIARHIDSLESEGFVETAKQGRTKAVEPTDSGRIYLSSRESDFRLQPR
jgi:CRISPR-associated protein Csa3